MELENPTATPIDQQTPPVDNTIVPSQAPTPTSDLTKDPNVIALVEAVRKQEKDKLYKSLEAKDGQLKSVTEELESIKGQLKDKESAKMEELTQLQETIKGLQQQQADLLAQMERQKEEAELERQLAAQEKAQAELKAYKAEAIRLAGDDLIVELVGGSSKEEIDASIEKAKAKYAEIEAKLADKNKEVRKQEKITNTTRVTAPPSSSVQPLTLEQIKKMSNEDYAKNRDSILEAARKGLIQG
jgi:chromosome segregation ATPase